MISTELTTIIKTFADSGWDLIGVPSKTWLETNGSADASAQLIGVVEQADKECGNCGCKFDPLYKKALELLRAG